MVPIKFEDHLREKLQSRELQPGKEAWQKLSENLGEEPRDQGRKYWLYGIAASLLIAVFVGRSLLSEDVQQQEPILVEESTQNSIPKTEAETTPAIKEQLVEEKLNPSELAQTETESVRAEKVQSKQAVPETNLAALEPEKTETSIAMAKAETKITDTEPAASSTDPFTDAKVAEVVDAVLAIQQRNKEVSPEEIDALLAKANREIANQRLLEQASGKIDPMSLLSDVEMELERSFRDRVFDALGKGFNQVRTAVVQRNN